MTELQTLGWALVHSLWQGALGAAGLAALFAIIPARAARSRYALAVATLVVMAAFPLVTALQLGRGSPRAGPTEPVPVAVAPATLEQTVPGDAALDLALDQAQTAPAMAAPEVATRARAVVEPPSRLVARVNTVAARVRTALEPALPWLVAVWLAGVLVLSLRLASGWRGARGLKRVGVSPAPRTCVEALARLAARLGVSRPVRVLRSAVVEVPAVIGWLRPVILLPASALTGLTPLQLDALLAHELAHVRRHDYLVNVVQTVIETLLFYHPAVWWVSRRVREEREHCCDDVAVAVCGDAHFYATVLHGMERLRAVTPTLALAAGGTSLAGRIRRLVAPASSDMLPRWVAGLAAVGLVLAIGGSVRLAAADAAEREQGGAQDLATAAPDTVLQHPNPARPFGERWAWAQAELRGIEGRSVWIGYRVRPSTVLEHAGYVARDTTAVAPDSGSAEASFGDVPGSLFHGVRLTSLVDGHASDALALLLRFTRGGWGKPVLERVQVASVSLPVDFGGEALLWLGPADDDASLARLRALFAEASRADLREHLIAAIGLHSNTDAVVSMFEALLGATEPANVRAQVAEGLGHHPSPAAVRALVQTARRDPSAHVRREAVEALSENLLPAAGDSLIALARTLQDVGARSEAVDELGQRRDPSVLATLIAIARDDLAVEVQREAVESLAELATGAGRAALVDLARTHRRPEVRREAIEMLAESFRDPEVVQVLASIAREDRHVDVQKEAVEALGEIEDDGLLVVIELARTHPNPEVRREAVKTIGEAAPPAAALELLREIAGGDRDGDVQREAVATLGELPDERVFVLLIELARHHPNGDVRRKALERYAQAAAPDSALALLTDRLANDRSVAVRREAIQRLVELPDGAGIPAVAVAARTDPDHEVRTQASRRLDGGGGTPKARELSERGPREQ